MKQLLLINTGRIEFQYTHCQFKIILANAKYFLAAELFSGLKWVKLMQQFPAL